MIRHSLFLTALLTASAGWGGCAPAVHFPWQDAPEAAQLVGAIRAYDADHDGTADFFLFANDQGRVNRIGFGLFGFGQSGGAPSAGDQAQHIVHLDEIDLAAAPHVVIILDGIGYDVLRNFYDQGHLRYFHPPSRVIAPYPSMTDLALEDAFDYVPAKGMEAKYFDRQANTMAGGSMNYLKGGNQPYDDLLHYRADLILDALGYLAPSRVFKHELNKAKKVFDAANQPTKGGFPPAPELLMYFVSSAGLGTAKGEAGQIEVLVNIERFVNQLMYETRGRIRLTMFADHGHSYTPGRRLPLEKLLAARGWNMTDKLKDPRDVVYVRFGLVTCASFSTNNPYELAPDLAAIEGVELASHAFWTFDGARVAVHGRDGSKAIIHRGFKVRVHHEGEEEGYFYQPVEGDPLNYLPILANVPRQADGSYRDADLLAATADCEYPVAIQRLWRAHFGLVENPPDVLISLSNDVYSGSRWMDFFATVASTHGSLNRVNSTTFVMTTMGPLPPILQSRDLAPAMGRLLGGPFPRWKP